jgi:hypothetical protein
MRTGVDVRQIVIAAALAIAAGCGASESPTSPTTTTETPETPEAVTITESFNGTVAPGSARFYSFDVGVRGTVNLTLDSIGGRDGVPATVWVGLGLGVPDGTDCATTTSLNTQSGTTPQVSTVVEPGTYCARVYDIGNLAASAAFAVTIVHQ